jgi:hypothetical protein
MEHGGHGVEHGGHGGNNIILRTLCLLCELCVKKYGTRRARSRTQRALRNNNTASSKLKYILIKFVF